MNLFSPKPPASAPIPTVDDAQLAIDAMKRDSQMTSRASSMLTTNPTAKTAQRTVTGY